MVSTTTTTGSKIVVFGDISAAFGIVDRIGLSVELIPHIMGATNRYPLGQRGVYAFWRVGSGVLVGARLRVGSRSSSGPVEAARRDHVVRVRGQRHDVHRRCRGARHVEPSGGEGPPGAVPRRVRGRNGDGCTGRGAVKDAGGAGEFRSALSSGLPRAAGGAGRDQTLGPPHRNGRILADLAIVALWM